MLFSVLTLLVADDDWPHSWLWPLVPLAWLIVLVLLIRFLVWPWWRRGSASGLDRARGIVAERYAGGELTYEEYRERLARLSEAETRRS